jgi:hypothetical protein
MSEMKVWRRSRRAFDDDLGRDGNRPFRDRDDPQVSISLGFGTFGHWSENYHRRRGDHDGSSRPGQWDTGWQS